MAADQAPGSPEVWDEGGLDEIGVAECWQLLATEPVGRVAVVVGQYAHVVPVNYAVEGRSITFFSGAGTKLWALGRSNVTFEADEVDPGHRTGWSVMVKGSAIEVSVDNNPNLVAGSRAAGAVPWAPGPRSRLVRLVPDQVTGRRIRAPEPSPEVTEQA